MFLMIVIKGMKTVDGNRGSFNCVKNKLIETKKNNKQLLTYKDYDDDQQL